MRYFLQLAYNGTNYHGWQSQTNAVSVQALVKSSLSLILGIPTDIMGAGRTDAGVHASNFFAHFDSIDILDTQKILYKLNAFLPKDIVIYNLFLVSDNAHARFDALSRTYQYHVVIGKNPFVENAWLLPNQPSIDKMNLAASYLFLYDDFSSFSKSHTDTKTNICSIKEAFWTQNGDTLIFTITANRFLRNMVRSIVGTLITIGQKKILPEDLKLIIEQKQRKFAGISAPAKGLFLTEIKYPKNIFL